MDNNNVEQGGAMGIISMILGIITYFSPSNIEFGMKIFVAIGSVVTAILACRYYLAALKEKNQQISINQEKLKKINAYSVKTK